MKSSEQTAVRDLVVVDFDGTLAAADIGNRLFRRFGTDPARWEHLIDEWKHGRITSRECLTRECEMAAGLDEAKALAFVAEFHLVGQSVTVPADLFTKGERYLFKFRSVWAPGVDLDAHPFQRRFPFGAAEALSGTITFGG